MKEKFEEGLDEMTLSERSHDTIIVGAGVAGLACARRLDEAQHPFLVIAEDVGGRICRSADGSMNLGAYYVRADYHHINELVTRGRRINAHATSRHDRLGSYTLWSQRLLLHLPQALRFLWHLFRFRRHYEVFKANCVAMSQAQAIRSDPHLWHLYQQPASEFIRQHRLESVARSYMAPGLHGTAFVPLSRLTAFTLMLGALPVVMPIFEFTVKPRVLEGNWSRNLLADTVTGITPDGDFYRVNTKQSGGFIARHVVVATPPEVAQRLLGIPELKSPVEIHTFHMTGTLRKPWRRAEINLFAEDDPMCAIAHQANGSVLVCSHDETPVFARYFIDWEVIEHKWWNPAFNIVGDTLLECEQAPNLFLIGDHNICGLEDAYITGLHAANRITRTSPVWSGSERLLRAGR
jgi:hypothetical protein